jgi:hypothetical protein
VLYLTHQPVLFALVFVGATLTAPREAEPSLPPLGELTSEIAPLDLPASMRPKPRERKDDL